MRLDAFGSKVVHPGVMGDVCKRLNKGMSFKCENIEIVKEGFEHPHYFQYIDPLLTIRCACGAERWVTHKDCRYKK